jgi:hypothetical protein
VKRLISGLARDNRRKHTDWCAQGHHCNLSEHRSESVVVDIPHRARGVLTRVMDDQGAQYAEVRIRVALHSTSDRIARRQLHDLLTGVRIVLSGTALPVPALADRRDGRAA